VSANLDPVRSIYAAWERGDFSSAEWAHPEIEFVAPDGPDPGTWKGLAEMTESWRSQVSAWEAFDAVADEVRQLDDERVLVLSHFSGRGKTSGIDLHQVRGGAKLFHVCGGKVTRYVIYWDRDRAFADLGLAPRAPSARSPLPLQCGTGTERRASVPTRRSISVGSAILHSCTRAPW
jgi:ketosteroid isomerase-like protein